MVVVVVVAVVVVVVVVLRHASLQYVPVGKLAK